MSSFELCYQVTVQEPAELKSYSTYVGRFYQACREQFRSLSECLLAMVLLMLASPFVLLGALAVKFTSRGPMLYSQTRLGKNGRPFAIYKIRTMHHNCERHSGACWSSKGDPRITPVGRILRLTHVDELPQLWNVLCRQMSLVGPRPERPEFVPKLGKAVPRYTERLRVRPGLTGLAQVTQPPDTDIESVRRKIAFDLYYIENLSLWLDLRILASTALIFIGLPAKIGQVLFALPKTDDVEPAYLQSLAHSIKHRGVLKPAQHASTTQALTQEVAPSEWV